MYVTNSPALTSGWWGGVYHHTGSGSGGADLSTITGNQCYVIGYSIM